MKIYLITMQGCPKCIQAKNVAKQFPELRIQVLDKDETKAKFFIQKHALKRAPAFIFHKEKHSYAIESLLEATGLLEELVKI